MQVSTDKLIKDLRTVVVDTEDLLATAGQTGRAHREGARARLESCATRAHAYRPRATTCATAQDSRKVDSQVRANPWAAAAIAAAIGLVLGILLGRNAAAQGSERPGVTSGPRGRFADITFAAVR
jgi:ElaB/YqjD/DUF883 family membrane-anchored ribosome-binding protein